MADETIQGVAWVVHDQGWRNYINTSGIRRTRREAIDHWNATMTNDLNDSWRYDKLRRKGEVKARKVTITLHD